MLVGLRIDCGPACGCTHAAVWQSSEDRVARSDADEGQTETVIVARCESGESALRREDFDLVDVDGPTIVNDFG